MKRCFAFLAACVVSAFAGTAFSAEGGKIASIDIKTIVLKSKAGIEAKKKLGILTETMEKTRKEKEAELNKMKSSLEKQITQLTHEELSSKNKDLEGKIKVYREFIKQSQKELNDKNEEYTNNIVDTIKRLTKEFASKNNYNMVVVKSSLVYNNEKNQLVDITADVLEFYDKTAQDLLYESILEPGVIMVDAKTMVFLKELGPDVIFFTPKEKPLKRLSDITNGDDQFAAWGPPPEITDLYKLSKMFSGEHVHMIGNGNFAKLFLENPKLKLFVTGRAVNGVEEIDRNGGGMKVRFIEQSAQGQ